MQQASPPRPLPCSLAERLSLIAAIIGQLPESLVARHTGRTPQELALNVLAKALEDPTCLPRFGDGSHAATISGAHRHQP